MTRLAVRISVALMVAMVIGPAPAGGATIVVDTMIDAIALGDGCSLREAILGANGDLGINECTGGSGADTIELTVGTYTLAIVGAGEDDATTGDLDITDDLTIRGAGTEVTIIDGAGLDRVFHVDPEQDGLEVELRNLTVRGGSVSGDNGGGIANFTSGLLTLFKVAVVGNTADSGAGIFNNNDLWLFMSEVSGNNGDDGAGIFTEGGSDTVITLSRIGGNTSATSAGGINNQGTMTINYSLIDGNTATGTGSGGGIFNNNQLTIDDSTLSGNMAGVAGLGGALRNGVTATLTHVTIFDNTALMGGGVYNDDSLTLDHTILAANSGGNCGGNAVTSNGFNLEDGAGCALANAGDQSNTDPELGPLQANGGPTETHALTSTSPAVDAGDAADTTGLDQRTAPRSVDGDGNGSAVRDIGAFELNPVVVVNTLVDGLDAVPGDGVCEVLTGSGICTLRAAIQETNAVFGWQHVLLGAGVHSLAIGGSGEDDAATGDLDIRDTVLIEGAGVGVTIVDGAGLDRVFDLQDVTDLLWAELARLSVTGGSETLGGCVRTSLPRACGLLLTEMEIAGCDATDRGGGLFLDGAAPATVLGTTIRDNQAGNLGGGVYGHSQSRLLLDRSTVSGNIAGGSGGGMETGIVALFNTTISGNTANSGGGLFTDNLTAIAHSTIAGNTATGGEGGGLFLVSKVLFHDSILAGNVGDPSMDNCLTGSGTPITRGFNLESSDSCAFGAIGDQVSTDPLLVPLAANGGPTRTHALLSASPAIDQGAAAACPAVDQRGVGRPIGSGCDIGALESLACQPLVLEDHTIDATVLYEACESITARNLIIGPSGDATLVAGRVVALENGFQVEGDLSVGIDPSLGVAGPGP